MIEIIPTVVPTSYADIEAAGQRYESFAPVLHVDFTDGRFAPNTTWLPHGESMVPAGIQLEAHLMVEEPEALGLEALAMGFTRVIGHVEAMKEKSPEILLKWKTAGATRVGIGICAQTPPAALDAYGSFADVVMIMTITAIGVQGLPSDPAGPARCAAVHAAHPGKTIQVDGAINESTIATLGASGASSFCAGSVLSKAADPADMYKKLMDLANKSQRES